jgi:FMN phosphatase YigB (HAD superfamily)
LIRAIVTDVDGTLYRQAYVRMRMAATLLRFGAGNPAAGWRTMRVLRAYRQAQEVLRATGDAGSAHEQVNWAASCTGYEKSFVSECVHRWIETEPLSKLLPARYGGLEQFCKWAQSNGLRMVALSDYNAFPKIRALGLESYFEAAVCASDPEVGIFKPNPRGLQVALARVGVTPDEAVYVGDRLDVDGETAIAGGVMGFVLTSRNIRCPAGVRPVRSWFEVRAALQGLLNSESR